MQIKNLKLENFRNYLQLDMNFSDGINIIYGENGQGKTNILEAVYMCGLGKSHRNVHEEELLKIGKQEAHIQATFFAENHDKRIDIHLKKNFTKGVAINRIPIKKISELYGNISVVMFSPEDLEIIKRGPLARRNFINLELCQIDPIYVNNLINYSKIIKQRHELLKKIDFKKEKKEELTDLLDIYDLQLADFGKKIIERRREYIEELNGLIKSIHFDISGKKEILKAMYEPSSDEKNLYDNLIKNREKDIIYKTTSTGPHRDEILFYVNEKNLKIYGSQGQQRTCALSLKLSEIDIIEKKKKEKPILLLDDVLSELDRTRQTELLKRIGNTQTIITCTGVDEFVEEKAGAVKKFYIQDAEIKN